MIYLNMRDIIIYVSDDKRGISQNIVLLNILVHDVINLLYCEYWTDKRKKVFLKKYTKL